jgi:hypothetical protein
VFFACPQGHHTRERERERDRDPRQQRQASRAETQRPLPIGPRCKASHPVGARSTRRIEGRRARDGRPHASAAQEPAGPHCTGEGTCGRVGLAAVRDGPRPVARLSRVVRAGCAVRLSISPAVHG